VILLRGVLAAAEAAGGPQTLRVRAAYELLAAAQHWDPANTEIVIRYPAMGAWALRTVRASRGGVSGPVADGAEPVMLSAVAAAAAIRARLPAEIEVPVRAGMAMLPSLGAAAANGNTAVVKVSGSGAEVSSADRRVVVPADPHMPARGWLPLRRIRLGSRNVLVDDLDPFRMPALADTAPRLTGADIAEWAAALGKAWSLLETKHATVAAEGAEAITVIVPHLRPPRGHSSSSSSETFGAVAMSQPIDLVTSAVTLAHELQHLKLFALIDLVPLTLPDDGQRYYAPWRDDPRPLDGLLQGTYAFLGVSGFWRQQRGFTGGDAGLYAQIQFARWLAATAQTVETLSSSGRLTAAGQEFVAGMARTLRRWADEPIPEQAREAAQYEARAHLARWLSNQLPHA
jgi:HEXXH motif-containing protein